ncbi:MAG: hypothetical protein A2Y15_02335 [Clostridiales bacterium GWF2_36_10]|nr:MAG: hypothetical protein A2Y15_02335 [Clostridiales bacterium GWF2_36_10]HAN21264.1 hypothetical protein [Clostridiales bacterium]
MGKSLNIKRCITIFLATSLLLIMSACKPVTNTSEEQISETISETESTDMYERPGNLSANSFYSFSFTDALTVENDDGIVLTGNAEKAVLCTVKDVPFTFVDWNDGNRNTSLFEEKPGAYYLKNDFGFPAVLNESYLYFDKTQAIPEKVELFWSDDGYNFNFYAGEMTKTEKYGKIELGFTFLEAVTAKAVKYYIYSPVGTTNAITSIKNYGTKTAERILISDGITYKHDAGYTGNAETKDTENKKLTDGNFGVYDIYDPSVAILRAMTTDTLMKRKVINIDFDLGELKNVSELHLSAIKDGVNDIDFISVKYSENGSEYKDFCMTFAEGENRGTGNKTTRRVHYAAMRNHTVSTRYIKLQIFTSSTVALDEVFIYGSENAVSEPDYNFNKQNIKAHTDILTGLNMTVNQSENDFTNTLTDTNFVGASSFDAENKTVTFETEINDKEKLKEGYLSGAAIFLPDSSYEYVDNTSVFLAVDGGNYTEYNFGSLYNHSVAGLTSVNTYFNIEVKASVKVKFVFTLKDNYSDKKLSVSGLQLYCGNAQKPLIVGGFYGFFIDYIAGYNPHHYFDKYRIYILLKGYKELGMELIISPNNMEYNTKKILAEPNESLTAKGYVKTSGHGVYDINKAILSACDKLQMKCLISTVLSSNYPDIQGTATDKKLFYQKVVEDSELLIPYLYEHCKDYESFFGFYLTDESCDQWLASDEGQGVNVFRTLYEGQSNIIRELDKNLKIAIAPAAWRSDTPANFAKNMFELIKPADEKTKPVVDIVTLQDCLGRENQITVSTGVYFSYEKYLDAVSSSVKSAGAEFYNDTEIFDIGYRGKRYTEIINSLNLEYKYTAGSVVFDLPHYFSSQSRGSFDSYKYFDFDYIVSQYVKYYSTFDD